MSKKFIFYILIACIFSQKSFSVFTTPSLKNKIAQMLLIGFQGSSALDPKVQYIKKWTPHLGGVLFYARNLKNPEQIKALLAYLKPSENRLWFAIDQEGGFVARFKEANGFKNFDSAKKIAEKLTAEEAYETYFSMANMIKDAGFNLNLAPVVDLDFGEKSLAIGKYERAFHQDPQVVIQYAQQFIQAHHANDVMTVLKHAPGHGSAATDSHLGFTDVTGTWMEAELIPYQQLVQKGFAPIIMTAHVTNKNIDENYPATLSKNHINVIQNAAHFDGLFLTDCLQMQAIDRYFSLKERIIRTIQAGHNILLFSNVNALTRNYAHELDAQKDVLENIVHIIEQAIEAREIPLSMVEESYQKIQELKKKVGFNGQSND